MSLWFAKALRPVLAKLLPVEGTLAADSLIQSPRRTSGTITALMLSLALVISLGGLARASYDSLFDWMKIALEPRPLRHHRGKRHRAQLRLPLHRLVKACARFLAWPKSSSSAAFVSSIKGTPIMVVALEINSLAQHAKLPPVEGNESTMYDEVAAGPRCHRLRKSSRACTEPSSARSSKSPDRRETLHLPILGIVRDFSDQQGSIVMDRSTYIRPSKTTRSTFIASISRRRLTKQRFGKRSSTPTVSTQRLFVLTNKDVRDFVIRITDQWVRSDLRADRRRRPGRDPRHRQRANRVHHRSPPRTRAFCKPSAACATKSVTRSGWRRSPSAS